MDGFTGEYTDACMYVKVNQYSFVDIVLSELSDISTKKGSYLLSYFLNFYFLCSKQFVTLHSLQVCNGGMACLSQQDFLWTFVKGEPFLSYFFGGSLFL